MKSFSILMRPETHRALRVLAGQHGVRQGDVMAGLVLLADATPVARLARILALVDTECGGIVEPGDEAAHIAQERARGALPARTDEF